MRPVFQRPVRGPAAVGAVGPFDGDAVNEDLEAFLQGDKNAIVIIDPSAASLKAELRKRGFRLRDAKNDVREGIAAMSGDSVIIEK